MMDIWPVGGGSVHVPSEASGCRGPASSQQTEPADRGFENLLKRLLDVALALACITILAGLFALIATTIALTSPGPVLFRQRRTGLNGRVFTIYKFRTMTVVEDGDLVSHATRNDPRLTRPGSLLRKTSLDELPQVINILKGDMSFVGPRPHALAHDCHYGALIPTYDKRFSVRPGLTGLAQVRGMRGEIHRLECMSKRVEADTDYAANWSLLGDVVILIRTLPVLLYRVNAY